MVPDFVGAGFGDPFFYEVVVRPCEQVERFARGNISGEDYTFFFLYSNDLTVGCPGKWPVGTVAVMLMGTDFDSSAGIFECANSEVFLWLSDMGFRIAPGPLSNMTGLDTAV